jgi:hypothetical protein
MNQEEMAAWLKYANPAENHEFLKKLAGEWDCKTKFWMQPGAPPQESSGTSSQKMILGGRFLQGSYTGEMMDQPFQGMSIDGYDNHTGKYFGLWMDTMGTKAMVFYGTCDGNVREMICDYDDPFTNRATQMKGVTKIVSENEFVYEGWNKGPDGEFLKQMEVVYTRQ